MGPRLIVLTLALLATAGAALNLNVVAMFPQGTVTQMQIWVENHGRSDVLFNSPSVSIAVKGSGKKLQPLRAVSNVTFPHALKPGGSFYVMEDRLALVDGLARMGAPNPARIRAVAHDAIDRTFYSDWQKVSASQPDR